MNKQDLIQLAASFVQNSSDNYINEQNAISEEIVGMKIFETPIFAFGSPDDPYFKLFKDPLIIGEHFLIPKEWFSSSKTVISFFLPFTQAVRESNKKEELWPSNEWLHGRIEGQAFIFKLLRYLKSELINAGYNSLVPSLDKRFWSANEPNSDQNHSSYSFTSTWSERHAAFVCGLGTFSLSKGLITSKGIAGRFGSLLTDLYLEPDKREYKKYNEYCSLCGACVQKCPVKAITVENGKNHIICAEFLKRTGKKFNPRFGCGKCQVGVPCESRIPDKI